MLQTITLMHTLLSQNYFQYNHHFYKHQTGIAMGSPLSSIATECYLQYLEELLIKHWLESKHIIFHRRYVDDILIIYDQKQTTIDHINESLNRLNPHLSFTYTPEKDNSIAYLDLTISRNTHTTSHEHAESLRKLTPPSTLLPTTRYSINWRRITFTFAEYDLSLSQIRHDNQNGIWFAVLPNVMPSQPGFYITHETKYFKNNIQHWLHVEGNVKIGSLLLSIARLYTKSQSCSNRQRSILVSGPPTRSNTTP
jgi:hypothetical protein